MNRTIISQGKNTITSTIFNWQIFHVAFLRSANCKLRNGNSQNKANLFSDFVYKLWRAQEIVYGERRNCGLHTPLQRIYRQSK